MDMLLIDEIQSQVHIICLAPWTSKFLNYTSCLYKSSDWITCNCYACLWCVSHRDNATWLMWIHIRLMAKFVVLVSWDLELVHATHLCSVFAFGTLQGCMMFTFCSIIYTQYYHVTSSCRHFELSPGWFIVNIDISFHHFLSILCFVQCLNDYLLFRASAEYVTLILSPRCNWKYLTI